MLEHVETEVVEADLWRKVFGEYRTKTVEVGEECVRGGESSIVLRVPIHLEEESTLR